jgi:uncharacterized membrane protein
VESAYAATLPPRERRLAVRIEGFGDIVFGFAVSQCAIQLPLLRGHVDIARGASLAAYFGTFAILVSLWLTFHRILSESFRPKGIDLFLAFAYLAFVTLMPFAMYSLSHQTQSLEAARTAIAEYAILFAILLLIGAILTLRNLRRGWYVMGADDRDFAWIAFVRRVSLACVLSLALGLDVFVGPIQSSASFVLMAVAPAIVRLRVRHAPQAARLRIPTPQTGVATTS